MEKLRSEFRFIDYVYNSNKFKFTSDLGVFSSYEINVGSKLLVESYIKLGRSNVSVLDIGCGYGFIGIVLSVIMNCIVTMSDNNQRATHLAKMNVDNNHVEAKVIDSNVYDNIKEKYDVIITNPPVTSGKDVVRKILDEAVDHLNENGEVWFVLHKNQGAESMVNYLKGKYSIEIIDKSKGFWVIKLKCYWH